MATLATLRSELVARLQRGTPAADFSTLLTYAINSAKNKIVMDSPGVSGVTHRALVGETWGQYTPTGSLVFTQGSASATGSSESLLNAGIFPGDVLQLTISGEVLRFLLYPEITATTLNIGAPWTRSNNTVTSGNWTVYRRTIELPTVGTVTGVTLLTGNDYRGHMEIKQDAAQRLPLATGDPLGFSAAYDPGQTAAFVSLYPAPITRVRVVVQVSDVPADLAQDADVLDWPAPTLDLLLDKARETALVWMNHQSSTILLAAGMERRNSAQAITGAASPRGRQTW